MNTLYIQVESGVPINHPALEDNLLAAFGDIPNNWEPFTRVASPVPTTYQIQEEIAPTYEKVGGVWTDVWLPCRDMTEAEKTAQQQLEKDEEAKFPSTIT